MFSPYNLTTYKELLKPKITEVRKKHRKKANNLNTR